MCEHNFQNYFQLDLCQTLLIQNVPKKSFFSLVAFLLSYWLHRKGGNLSLKGGEDGGGGGELEGLEGGEKCRWLGCPITSDRCFSSLVWSQDISIFSVFPCFLCTANWQNPARVISRSNIAVFLIFCIIFWNSNNFKLLAYNSEKSSYSKYSGPPCCSNLYIPL